MSKQKKLNKAQLELIKKMFMDYKNPTEIAKEFSVARNTITWHINSNAWAAERKLSESEVFSSFDDSKKVDFVKMTQAATQIMARSLNELATRHEPPTINEATRAADILKTLDNILRLDEGKPTDIIESTDKPLSESEIKKRLAADPFSKPSEEEDEKKLN